MRRPTVDGWSADLATISRDIGSLLAMESALMGFSVLVALLFGEWYPAAGFLLAGVITASVGLSARLRFEDAPAPQMKHGMIIAAAGWFSVAVFGSIPLILAAHLTPPSVMATYVPADVDTTGWEAIAVGSTTTVSSLAYFQNPLHALFESMSGWTGSGLTMAIHEPSLPRSMQWWRSLIQYVGGVGVIVLTVSILARPGSGSYALYRSEAREERIHPSVISTVRTVWKILLLYTGVSILLLFVAIWASDYGKTLPLWEVGWQALNHAMTGLTTGGFSVTDNSIATYDSPLIETALLPIMTLGAIAFTVHYGVLWNDEVDLLYEDLQTRWLFVLLAIGITVLSVQNFVATPTEADAFVGDWFGLAALFGERHVVVFRDSLFQWVSALTCTGFQSAPINRWSSGGKLIVSVAMTLGGAAGSTVGGIKIIRGYTISRGIRWQFARVFLPANAVVNLDIGDRHLDREEMEREFSEAAIISLLWIFLLIASSIVLVNLAGPEYGYADALFEIASAQGNVGLSSGITGPSMHPFAEAMFLFNMWIGRLEIIPVLAFIRSILYGLDP
ncbi:Trk potassium uptake system protein [Halogeometricum pallidum JCM 14848]|uniref:Trk potassium uptake system protein n=1 Tax=Halogeometricum pallidum JCM 14848 TaxID=1227487 RepID=M0DCD0_HALPD|nr:potassium transporter TrkG [Halogeometricum pallidum]ELZ32458.1 Trk potassium uptake system protein [Halogeometricum pallidum JCM 14848]